MSKNNCFVECLNHHAFRKLDKMRKLLFNNISKYALNTYDDDDLNVENIIYHNVKFDSENRYFINLYDMYVFSNKGNLYHGRFEKTDSVYKLKFISIDNYITTFFNGEITELFKNRLLREEWLDIRYSCDVVPRYKTICEDYMKYDFDGEKK